MRVIIMAIAILLSFMQCLIAACQGCYILLECITIYHDCNSYDDTDDMEGLDCILDTS